MRFSSVVVLCLLTACAPATSPNVQPSTPSAAAAPPAPSAPQPGAPTPPAAAPAAPAPTAPVAAAASGVYTQAQARRGRTLFDGSCTACHSASDFSGDAFMQRWGGESAAELFNLVRSSMPQDSPGSLEPQQYADILAFFFSASGMPAGTTDLPGEEDVMRAITIRR